MYSTARAVARFQSSVVLERWPDSRLELAEARLSDARVPPNITFDRTAGSRSLAAAGQRDRWADKMRAPQLFEIPAERFG